jgi:hypothetical protein
MCKDGRCKGRGCGWPIGESCTGLFLHQPQAPACIKKARPTSRPPHNRAQPAQNCTPTLTRNLLRPLLTSLVSSHIPRPFTIAARARGKTRLPPTPTVLLHPDPSSRRQTVISANRLGYRKPTASLIASCRTPPLDTETPTRHPALQPRRKR